MKTYGDEGWISLLQDRMERARNRKIQNGSVFVGDEALGFAEREIIKDRLWMWLPEQFQKMPARMAKQKYPEFVKQYLQYNRRKAKRHGN